MRTVSFPLRLSTAESIRGGVIFVSAVLSALRGRPEEGGLGKKPGKNLLTACHSEQLTNS